MGYRGRQCDLNHSDRALKIDFNDGASPIQVFYMIWSRDPHCASVLDEDAYWPGESSISSIALAGTAGSKTWPAMARVLGGLLAAISDTRLSSPADVRVRHATEAPAVAKTNAVDFPSQPLEVERLFLSRGPHILIGRCRDKYG